MQERLRGGSAPSPGPPTGPLRCWRVDAVVVGADQTLLSLRDGEGAPHTLVVDGRPDRTVALHHVSGLRRVSWVRIDVAGGAARCEVAGTTRRPVHVRVPLEAALALVDGGVPGMLVLAGAAA